MGQRGGRDRVWRVGKAKGVARPRATGDYRDGVSEKRQNLSRRFGRTHGKGGVKIGPFEQFVLRSFSEIQ